MALDKKSLKKMFPNLYRELHSSENKVSIDAVRKDPQQAEEEVCGCDECEDFVAEEKEASSGLEMPDKLRHFNPQAVDFIRRCDTEPQAEEIIAYLEKKGEITKDYAEQLRCQLKRDGVRSFGSKKEEYYYFKEGELC